MARLGAVWYCLGSHRNRLAGLERRCGGVLGVRARVISSLNPWGVLIPHKSVTVSSGRSVALCHNTVHFFGGITTRRSLPLHCMLFGSLECVNGDNDGTRFFFRRFPSSLVRTQCKVLPRRFHSVLVFGCRGGLLWAAIYCRCARTPGRSRSMK